MADRPPKLRKLADDKGKGKAAAALPKSDPPGRAPEPKRLKAGSSSKSQRAETPACRSRKELQDELSERGIKTAKSASKTELLELLGIVADLSKATSDIGTCSSPLKIAMCTNAFYRQLGSFSCLGRLSMVSKSYRAILVSRTAWEQVAVGMAPISKKFARQVLALPEGRISLVDGPKRVVLTCWGMKTRALPTNLLPQDAVRHALQFHGSAEQMYLARGKKTETRRKNALKPKKPRPPRKTFDESLYYGGAFNIGLMRACFPGMGWSEDEDSDYDSDDHEYYDHPDTGDER